MHQRLHAAFGVLPGQQSEQRYQRALLVVHGGVLMRFFTGLHQPSDARHFDAAFVSVNRLRKRKGAFAVGDWIMDSGAFTEISTHGHYRHGVAEYAAEIRRWAKNGNLLAAVGQDWMCEAHIVAKTGLSVERHQQLTVERYAALLKEDTAGVYILPVLQGYAPADYVRHIAMYGDRLAPGQWVGVGSVCKRNGDPRAIAAVLLAIKEARPDLRLHGFGLKTTALANPLVRSMLDTADSMAWSFHARINGRNGNDWREAARWAANIAARPVQHLLFRLMSMARTVARILGRVHETARPVFRRAEVCFGTGDAEGQLLPAGGCKPSGGGRENRRLVRRMSHPVRLIDAAA